MKIITSFLVVFGFLSSAGYAAIDSERPDYYPYDPIPFQGSSYAYCQGQTTCPNGMLIGCYAYGNSATYAACTGNYVECTGYNDLGIWATSWARCY